MVKLGDSFLYYLKLALSLSLLLAVIISMVLAPKISSTLSDDAIQKVLKIYPKDLEIKNDGKEFTSNAKEPYLIPTDKYNFPLPKKTNLLVIDTKNIFTFESFNRFDTAVMISKDYLVYTDNRGKIIAESAKTLPPVVVNANNLNVWIHEGAAIGRSLLPLLPIVVLLGLVFLFISYVPQILLIALIVWAALAIRKDSRGYLDALRITLHAVTAVLLLGTLLAIFSIWLPLFVPTILTAIIALANVWKNKVGSDTVQPTTTV